MAGADCAWAAELMQGRRAAYASYSPVFWRPAKGAVRLHTRFLQRQIARDDVTGLRTGHGFVIGELRRQEGFIDDFAVDDGQRWMDDGRGMLLAAWQRMKAQGARSLRVASAGRHLPKNALLASVGLAAAEDWWVKPLAPSARTERSGTVSGHGFSGHLGTAPPVYDPGGPVLLVRRIEPGVPLALMEREAATWGAVLVIVPEPRSGPWTDDLVAGGYHAASVWFLGVPGSGQD
jgi:hypothetical protein